MKWEYTIIGFALDEERLNKLGEQGWEAVAIEGNFLLLKRPTADSDSCQIPAGYLDPKKKAES